ncbi:hypothetical protein [Yinghuangia seranimata]|uniref:hypothetical protein n=1 Tax=Yinghuangia seranimata TaxID=408067 RepID=UPI00248C0C25|nr:hypothetical protein [Yinghuangia seranimata]MDI2132144.1 hypothetical protein [Yinghuangia seranimata]
MGHLVKIKAKPGTAQGVSCDVRREPGSLLEPAGLGDGFDAALAELLEAEAAVVAPVSPRGVDLVRLEPALAPGRGPDLPGIRAMANALSGPGRPEIRRIGEIAVLLAGLAELGRHALVADLAELAVRSLAANPVLVRNPLDWVWDAAVDLVDLHIAACLRTGRPAMRLPEPLSPARPRLAVGSC